jgi:hypothetical protein
VRITTRCCIAKAGLVVQLGNEIGEPAGAYTVMIPAHVLDAAARDTAAIPITDDDHRKTNDPEFNHASVIGCAANLALEGTRLMADVVFWGDLDLMREIRTGPRRQLSIAFRGEYECKGDVFICTDMKLDHVALVDEGRSGDACALPPASSSIRDAA